MLWAERLGRFEIDMALEQLQFAPVMTPRTLEELARILREGGRRDVAKIVSDLIPVVQRVVDNFFKPMSQARNEKAFWEDFDTFSREFEPYRLYINIRFFRLSTLQSCWSPIRRCSSNSAKDSCIRLMKKGSPSNGSRKS